MTNTTPTERADAIIAAESFVADVQFRIQTLLNDRAMKRAELARRLNVSEARVSHLFSAEAQNLTLRTLAKIFHALDGECYVTSPRLEELLGPPAQDMEIDEDDAVETSGKQQTEIGMVIRLGGRSSQAQRSYWMAEGRRFAMGTAADNGVPASDIELHAA